ncbi:hypothetical protein GTO89_15785 [Heliobacterium gestii]|uniref:Uncharacterized protein n=1 Tax=Heliomicrobium gestii TaxID=2699 RepID=A0A845LMA1_HELGE|nr:hypothetical protein [Heliomicrobium gestii]MBM7868302.1 hypothetical protein [Heliomicrobium gestii]MZP44493.1 hypothetical protein [Heliomicrobium gestii]
MSTTGFTASPATDSPATEWGDLAERMRLLSERSQRFSQQIPQVQSNIRKAQESMAVTRNAWAEICREVSSQTGLLAATLVTLNDISLIGSRTDRSSFGLGVAPAMRGRVVNG